MDELHVGILNVWHRLNDLPIPKPSHLNATLKAYGEAISAILPELTRLSNRAFEIQAQVSGQAEHARVQVEKIERMQREICRLWQAGVISGGQASRLLGVNLLEARKISFALGAPWCGEA
jgi:hypothetical protein